MAVLQCIKYEESLPSLLLFPRYLCLGGEKETHFLGDSEGRLAQSWACCSQGRQQGGAALPKFLL